MHISVLAIKRDTESGGPLPKYVKHVSGIGTALLVALALQLTSMPARAQVDEDAAVALARKSNCLKCHSVEKRKKAPSYKEIASKYSGNPNGEKLIFLHITGNPTVKYEDDSERHESPNTKDEKEIYNLVHWILSR
jgi:cytochrome c